MEKYGLYKSFAAKISDEDLTEMIPKAAEELLREIFTNCKEQKLKPKMKTLEIIYKEHDVNVGPFGPYVIGEDGEWTFIRSTLAVTIEAEEEKNGERSES